MKELSDFDAKKVIEVCADKFHAGRLVEWMNELIEEDLRLMTALVESADERRGTRIEHLASQISVYRRLADAGRRALLMETKPSGNDDRPLAEGML